MTLERFEELIAAYGADSARWPHEERAAMGQALETSADAAAILARAARLDAALDTRLAPASSDLEARILRDMHHAIGDESADAFGVEIDNENDSEIIAFPQTTPTPTRMVWSMATALAACFVGGIMIGPLLAEAYLGSGDLTVSLDIMSDIFLPTEPL
jgi:hypothetical protein